jgi:hypothetical protein
MTHPRATQTKRPQDALVGGPPDPGAHDRSAPGIRIGSGVEPASPDRELLARCTRSIRLRAGAAPAPGDDRRVPRAA